MTSAAQRMLGVDGICSVPGKNFRGFLRPAEDPRAPRNEEEAGAIK